MIELGRRLARAGAGFGRQFALFSALGLAFGCASSDGTAGQSDPGAAGAGSAVTLEPAAAASQELERLQGELETAASLDAAGFAAKTQISFAELVSYEPASASGMDLIQNSAFALNPSELAAFSKHGFVVTDREAFPSFMYGYASIYAEHLPLYISADSVLYAVHQSYDSILRDLEATALSDRLDVLLSGMQARLGEASFPSALRRSADLYLATARSLLRGSASAPLDPANAEGVSQLVSLASNAAGPANATVFGLARAVDFSQFKPRGHYTDSPELERYFRAMIWLGRIDLRLIDTAPDGTPVFRREQLEGAVALRQLMDAAGRDSWRSIDDAVTAFVGEHDDMTPPQIDDLLADLGVSEVSGLSSIPDQKLAQAVIDGGYGAQRIASQLVSNGLHRGTLPLARSFALMGQRFVFDSEVFSNVVYDRVSHPGSPDRLMPDPLDVAYAALNNDQAGMLLAPEVTQYGYAPELYGMRLMADEHDAEFWQGSLYNLWLGALRKLSPAASLADGNAPGLPSVATTDAWGRRLLNTQLASWAELRHDTLLYAKPSYTSGETCEFPTAYVDPYPEFFAALVSFAEHGKAVAVGLGNQSRLDGYFELLAEVAGTLRDMAQDQRDSLPLSAAHLEFVNRAVHINAICGGQYADGWYSQLFYDQSKAIEADPTIADVHTQPTDESGNEVGRVLHVATGAPRLMAVSVNGCTGAQAYVGLASTYYEQVTEHFERLTDEQWINTLQSDAPARPAWLPGAFVH